MLVATAAKLPTRPTTSTRIGVITLISARAALVALPKGDYGLELDDRWQPLRAKVTVGDDGGEVRFVRRE